MVFYFTSTGTCHMIDTSVISRVISVILQLWILQGLSSWDLTSMRVSDTFMENRNSYLILIQIGIRIKLNGFNGPFISCLNPKFVLSYISKIAQPIPN